MKLGTFSDVASLEVGSQMRIILILVHNPQIMTIIHGLWYNVQIMAIICGLYHNPWIIK